MKPTLPGTLWLNRGRWNWRVHLPGTPARRNYPLRLPGQSVALAELKGRDLAVSIAWRMWESATRKGLGAHDECMTLDDVCGLFLAHAETYYRRADGSPTREAFNCELGLRPLRALHGSRPIDDIAYQDILAARDGLIELGLNRSTINQRVGIWKRFFAWALENRHCSAQTKSEVWAIGNLKRNRSTAPESEPVLPVSHRDVKRTLPYMTDSVRAMVLVQELCGARPSEICAMRPGDIEKRRAVWIYRPASHKTEHKGGCRVVVLGPRAQKVLASVLSRAAANGYLFAPAQNAAHAPRDKWTTSHYGRAVRRAVRAARRDGVDVQEWAPNQLRHACGTRVRRKFGPELAGAVLGHATRAGSARITDNYTRTAIERELIAAASRPMTLIG